MNLDMTMFHQTFFEEAAESLNEWESLLLHLEETPNDPELLNTIFRCAHSIKGGSATFGFTAIAQFTHGLETLLDKVRNGQIGVDTSLTRLLLESVDQLKSLLAVARGEASSAPDSAPLTARVEAAIAGNADTAPVPAAAEAPSVPDMTEGEEFGFFSTIRRFQFTFAPGHQVLKQGADPILLLQKLADACEILAVECDLSSAPMLAELDPETCYLRWNIELRTDQEPDALLDIFEFIADESDIRLTEAGDGVSGVGCRASENSDSTGNRTG